MLDEDFKALAMRVCSATPENGMQLEAAFAALALRITTLIEPDVYTDGALDGARAAIAEFLAGLHQSDTLPRFTIARRRHFAHEALWALHDELRRQCESA